MVYQVGSPAMFEGNMFLPETGTPIWKMVRSRTVLALCEPEPFTVATWMLKSLTTGSRSAPWSAPLYGKFSCGHQYPLLLTDRRREEPFIIGQFADDGEWRLRQLPSH